MHPWIWHKLLGAFSMSSFEEQIRDLCEQIVSGKGDDEAIVFTQRLQALMHDHLEGLTLFSVGRRIKNVRGVEQTYDTIAPSPMASFEGSRRSLLCLYDQICVAKGHRFPLCPDSTCSFNNAIANCSARTASSRSSDGRSGRDSVALATSEKTLLAFVPDIKLKSNTKSNEDDSTFVPLCDSRFP